MLSIQHEPEKFFAEFAVPNRVEQNRTVGETRDFRFVPTQPGELTLGVYDADNNNMLVASQKIEVTSR